MRCKIEEVSQVLAVTISMNSPSETPPPPIRFSAWQFCLCIVSPG